VSTTPKKWEPKIGEEYYGIYGGNYGYYVDHWEFTNDETDKHRVITNNYFRTRELAIVAMNAIEDAIDKLFKESIMTIPKWKPKIGEEYYIVSFGIRCRHFVFSREFTNDEPDKHYLRTNNYFRTHELATVVLNAIENAAKPVTNKLFKESEHG
jgi:predicted hydrolase (HD superfamily)